MSRGWLHRYDCGPTRNLHLNEAISPTLFQTQRFWILLHAGKFSFTFPITKWQMNTHKVTSRNTTFWQKDNTVTPTFPLWHCFTALILKKILTAYVSCTYSVHTLTFLYFSENSDKRHDRKHTSLCSLFFVLLQLRL